jgi:peptidyl-prolyl cis-trans isomerase A (cyclophilin A)
MNKLVTTLLVAAALGGSLFAQVPQKAAPRPPHPTTRKPAAPAKTQGSLLHPETLNEKAPDVYRARFSTTKGDFVVEVTRAWAPLGADRFYNLVKNGFFTDASFFRVVPDFVVQFGISAKPEISQAWDNARIKDDPVTQTNRRGSLTFATAGPNTRTTQLFINLVDNPRLDTMGFSPFGQVVEGMEAVEKIYSGYGETPDQARITSEGKVYLDKEFPKLDSIKSAAILTPAAPSAKPK